MRLGILTLSGRYFDLLGPESSELSVADIAHGLAHVCRFAGHTRTFYSVAQHSVLVSLNVPHEYALQAPFHDAAEAFVGDMPAPLKRLFPSFRALEKRIERTLLRRLGLPEILASHVKHADLVLLATERRELMAPAEDDWELLQGIEPLDDRIVPLGIREAREMFVTRFQELSDGESPYAVLGPERRGALA